MPMKLSKLVVNRVDLVDRGANPDAHVVLFKRDVKKTTFNDLMDLHEFQEVVWELMDMCLTLEDAIYSSLYVDGDRAAEIQTSVKQFSEQVDAALASWLDGTPVEKRDAQSVVEKLRTRVRHLLKEDLVSETKKEVTETPGDAPVEEATPVEKTEATPELPEEVKKRLADAEAALEAAKTEAADAIRKRDEAVNVAKEERDRREFVELKKRADDEFGHLPGTTDERATILKAMATLPEAVSKSLTVILKAAETAMVNAMTEVGDSRVTDGTAEAVVEKRVQELLDTKVAKTREQAMTEVFKRDNVLYLRYRAEKK